MGKFTVVRKKLYCYLTGATTLCFGNTCAIKLCRSAFSYNFDGIVQFGALMNSLLSQNVKETR